MTAQPSDAAHYDQRFYNIIADGSLRSALIVAPLVQELVRARSAVDVGCGVGTWLKAFQQNGVETVLGLDGSYVDTQLLQIPADRFRPTDLKKPIPVDQRYDLAICLEVGEHLPASRCSDLVQALVNFAPVVLFSAALPGQGGTNHINEQWPEFWAKRFAARGYRKLDVIRPQIWQNEQVEPWYRQNIYLYADEASARAIETKAHALGRPCSFGPELEIIGRDALMQHKSFRGLLGLTIAAARNAIRSRFSRL